MKRAKQEKTGSMKLLAAGLAAAMGMLTTGSAHAQERETRATVGAYAGYLFGANAEGKSEHIEDGSTEYVTSKASIASAPSYGAVIDLAVRRGAFAEFSYSRSSSDVTLRLSDGTQYKYDLLQQHIQIGGMLEFKTPSATWFRPIFGGTIGTTIFSADNNGFDYSEGALSLIFEGGANIYLARFLGIRLRARGLGTFLTDDSALLCVGGACAYAYTGTVMLQAELGVGAFLAF